MLTTYFPLDIDFCRPCWRVRRSLLIIRGTGDDFWSLFERCQFKRKPGYVRQCHSYWSNLCKARIREKIHDRLRPFTISSLVWHFLMPMVNLYNFTGYDRVILHERTYFSKYKQVCHTSPLVCNLNWMVLINVITKFFLSFLIFRVECFQRLIILTLTNVAP